MSGSDREISLEEAMRLLALAERKAKEEHEAREEAERKAKEAERKAKEEHDAREQERKGREEAEQKAKEEHDAREAAEREAREAEQRRLEPSTFSFSDCFAGLSGWDLHDHVARANRTVFLRARHSLFNRSTVPAGEVDSVVDGSDLHHPIPNSYDEKQHYIDLLRNQMGVRDGGNVCVMIPHLMHMALHLPNVGFWFAPVHFRPPLGWNGPPEGKWSELLADWLAVPEEAEEEEGAGPVHSHDTRGSTALLCRPVSVGFLYAGAPSPSFHHGDVVTDVPLWLAQLLVWNLGQYVQGGRSSLIDPSDVGSVDPPGSASGGPPSTTPSHDPDAPDPSVDPPTTPATPPGPPHSGGPNDAGSSPRTSSAALTEEYLHPPSDPLARIKEFQDTHFATKVDRFLDSTLGCE